ncbi:O-acyltransferase like protein-like [Hetaerina americana]|uniref:O-acyltransferase like protein-like n=1 Tax=Hetaerina americana TaxID=62018 RepID=UPI003A7F4358
MLLTNTRGGTTLEALSTTTPPTQNSGAEISTASRAEVSGVETMQTPSCVERPPLFELPPEMAHRHSSPLNSSAAETTTSSMLPPYHSVHQSVKYDDFEEWHEADAASEPVAGKYYEEKDGGELDYWDVLRESQISGFEASIEAALVEVGNERCREETRELLKGLRNFTLWATQIFDASVKYPIGILSGNVYNMGDFDECLSVRGPQDIRGRYCLAHVEIKEPEKAKARRLKGEPMATTQDPFAVWLHPMTSTWEQIEFKGARWRHRRDTAFWAMCVPASCSAGDLQTVMNHVLPPLGFENGIQLKVTVRPQDCSVGSHPEGFGTADWAFCTRAVSTSLLLHEEELQQAAHGYEHRWPEGHVRNQGPLNGDDYHVPQGNRQVPYMLTLHGDLVVDTFFAVGAFLLAYTTLKEWEAGKGAGLGVAFFLRYIRLTPAYALVVFFYGTLLKKLGSGPLWNSTVAYEADFCTWNWWTNLLYVSNYVNSPHMCMVQSWYLPCDMHYFLIGLLLLALLRRRPWAGHAFLVLFAVSAVAVPFAVTLAGEHDATMLFYRDFLSNPRASKHFQALYTKSHTRAGPYVAGLIAGYIFHKRKLNETKMSKWTARALFAVSVLLFAAILFPAVVFYTPQVEYDAWGAASYAALQRFIWGVAVSALVVSLASGKICLVSSILCWTPFVALGKLTYCAYLVHFTFQLIGLGADRNPNYVTNYNVLLKSTGETVFTFSLALILYLMVEAPFRDIGRLLVISFTAKDRRRKPRAQGVDKAVAQRRGPIGFPDGGKQEVV